MGGKGIGRGEYRVSYRRKLNQLFFIIFLFARNAS